MKFTPTKLMLVTSLIRRSSFLLKEVPLVGNCSSTSSPRKPTSFMTADFSPSPTDTGISWYQIDVNKYSRAVRWYFDVASLGCRTTVTISNRVKCSIVAKFPPLNAIFPLKTMCRARLKDNIISKYNVELPFSRMPNRTMPVGGVQLCLMVR